MDEEKIKTIELKAIEIRKDILRMLLEAGSGHSAGSLGMADVFATLYFSGILNWDPIDPWNEGRDRVILSAGHIAPVWYATLAHAGAFSHEELKSLRKLGSGLQGHPHMRSLPGVENTAGPLGQGISQAVGLALAAKMSGKDWKVYCIMSDGEMQEGQVWEALMMAGKEKLGNLVIIVDRNLIQISGRTEEVMPLEPLVEKCKAFNLDAVEVDGHDVIEIKKEIEKVKGAKKTTVIIAKTIPGKGVEFMENKYEWHGIPPNAEQAREALFNLRSLWGNIRAGE